MHLRFFLILCFACLAIPVWAADAERFAQGIAAYDSGRYEEAYEIFYALADEDIAAARNVGFMLRKGQGVEKDPHSAQLWLERAARGGLATAAADLGEMLLDGEADSPNPKAAFGWLAAAASAGHPIAAFRLGEMYETGSGTTENLDAARNLYAYAAAAGVEGAQARLAKLPEPQTDTVAPVFVTPAAKHQGFEFPTPAMRPRLDGN